MNGLNGLQSDRCFQSSLNCKFCETNTKFKVFVMKSDKKPNECIVLKNSGHTTWHESNAFMENSKMICAVHIDNILFCHLLDQSFLTNELSRFSMSEAMLELTGFPGGLGAQNNTLVGQSVTRFDEMIFYRNTERLFAVSSGHYQIMNGHIVRCFQF